MSLFSLEETVIDLGNISSSKIKLIIGLEHKPSEGLLFTYIFFKELKISKALRLCFQPAKYLRAVTSHY
jgi:hypothetical protein